MKARSVALLAAFLAASAQVFPASDAVQLINQRQITLLEKARRPDDPWPRGEGHALIGEPGGPLSQKGYHEPAGSFTPSPGSFGVAVWIRDAAGQLVATSDSIPLDRIEQRYVFRGEAKIPSIENTTPYYQATWSYESPGRWLLELRPTGADYRLELVFRSVGPAGGPLESVIWDQSRLLLNRRWIATLDVAPVSIRLGDESEGGLRGDQVRQEPVASTGGWGFARLALAGATQLRLADTKPQFASLLAYERTEPQFTFEVPDRRFQDALRAQVATLMVGYIGRQTGPGEPINYPLAWERDGAYSLMAMAKAGQLRTAKELSVYFAENDFFGGFGAEGDAAGSATNALMEVAALLDDRAYYEWIWPHVVRKLGTIDAMMNAKTDLHREYVGPLAPHLLGRGKRHQQIAQPADANGLIVGAMDLHFPVLYINALSYRALVQGSRLASILGKPAEAKDWQAKAEQLRTRWTAVFGQPRYDNERNFMISVWPSWIVNKDFQPFVDGIKARRAHDWSGGAPKERPLWTYFTTAEAHQWLFLERPELTWETLNYFYANQCAPGLYTFWEGEGEENTFKQWEHYRGWLRPRHVTPHYWTASEMLLLHLDMLVYVDESKPDFELVIGGGVPSEWLQQDISVRNYRTKAGLVSWTYHAGALQVTVKGGPANLSVRPGVKFREHGAKLTLRHE